ncbi:hypothetical protein [Paraflavitalea sp. CAU 1676]|uniref:hypothetical protein n=1 Tax=Paraflavitalea sp. CAU 1676 TaxID=3032598 RepID=UPI0023DC4F2D|nr:hypothetical protein [Paraflavitalea sp. CAU 1676]MDF2187945.1 hypothetical protein [Paraflavitalea sp. CAU 1676]
MITIAICIAAALLLFFLLWKETKRAARQHLAWRIIASVIAVASITALLLKPEYTVSTAGQDQQAILVVTAGYRQEDLSRFRNMPAITTDAAIATNRLHYTADLLYYLQQHPPLNELHIVGDGLEEATWKQLAAKSIRTYYHPAPPPAGFTTVSWPRRLNKGQPFDVQGQYNNPGKDTVRIILTGLGTRFDSATIAPGSTQPFYLRNKPAHIGQVLYELETSATTTTEKLPVQVQPAQTVQVLLLSSSPGFDNKFLLSFLHNNHYKAIVRSTVSRNKYSSQFLDNNKQTIQNITPGLLEKIDLVICDNTQLAALTPAERNALKQQVEKGLGLILQTDSTQLSAPFTTGWQLAKQNRTPVNARPLIIPATSGNTAPVQPDQWISISANPQLQPLVTDNEGTVVAAAGLYGHGKLVVNTVNNTYSWVLGGHEPDYARFWSLLIQKAARRSQLVINWQTISAYPAVGNPVTIVMESTRAGLPGIETPNGRLEAEQYRHIPHTYTATWWPVKAGWQPIYEGVDSLSVYVFGNNDWSTVQAAQRITLNKQYSAVSTGMPASKQDAPGQEQRPVPPVMFWSLFLLAAGYLWWEEKKAQA